MAPKQNQKSAKFGGPAKPSNPPQHKPPPQRFHVWRDDVNWLVGIPGAALMGFVSIFVAPYVGPGWSAAILFGGVLLLIAVVLKKPRRWVRPVLVGSFTILVVVSVVVWNRLQPTPEEQQVDRLISAIKEADGWLSPPSIFPDSRQHIIDHYRAFDPTRWHAWDELGGNIEHKNLDFVVDNATAFEGRTVVTVGTIPGAGKEQGNGQILVQLAPLDTAATKFLKDDEVLTDLIPTADDRAEVLSSPVADSGESHLRLMCLVTPRPFVNQSAGYYWVVKGTVITVGRLARNDGSINQTAYMLCSSVERVRWP